MNGQMCRKWGAPCHAAFKTCHPDAATLLALCIRHLCTEVCLCKGCAKALCTPAIIALSNPCVGLCVCLGGGAGTKCAQCTNCAQVAPCRAHRIGWPIVLSLACIFSLAIVQGRCSRGRLNATFISAVAASVCSDLNWVRKSRNLFPSLHSSVRACTVLPSSVPAAQSHGPLLAPGGFGAQGARVGGQGAHPSAPPTHGHGAQRLGAVSI